MTNCALWRCARAPICTPEFLSYKDQTFHFICGYLRSRSSPSLAQLFTRRRDQYFKLQLSTSFLSYVNCITRCEITRSLQFPPKKRAYSYKHAFHSKKQRTEPIKSARAAHSYLSAHLLQQARANLSLRRPQHAIPTINVRGCFFSRIFSPLAHCCANGFCCFPITIIARRRLHRDQCGGILIWIRGVSSWKQTDSVRSLSFSLRKGLYRRAPHNKLDRVLRQNWQTICLRQRKCVAVAAHLAKRARRKKVTRWRRQIHLLCDLAIRNLR
jgi:hypothetical protein